MNREDYDICQNFDKYSVFKIIGYFEDKPIWNCMYTSNEIGDKGREECEEELERLTKNE